MSNVGFHATGVEIGVEGIATEPFGLGVGVYGTGEPVQSGRGVTGVIGAGGSVVNPPGLGDTATGGAGVVGYGGVADGGKPGMGVVGVGGGINANLITVVGFGGIPIPSGGPVPLPPVGQLIFTTELGGAGVVGLGGFLSAGVVGIAGQGFNSFRPSNPPETDSNVDGVQGFGAGPGGAGVHGVSNDNGGIGLLAESNGDTFVDPDAGHIVEPIAVLGSCSGAGGIAVLGECLGGSFIEGGETFPSIAVFGVNPSAPGLAGAFHGDVVINGDLKVIGTFDVTSSKSAAVPFPDGSYRRLYCMESPENWFEDFGTGHLVNGRAEVQLAADFASVANTESYHVFLSEYDDNNGLYAARRSSTGFEVRAKLSSTAESAFSYRVVAKRKGFEGLRLEKADVPDGILAEASSRHAGATERRNQSGNKNIE